MQLAAGIFFDDDLRMEAHASGANYWHVYTREICMQMGLMFAEVRRSGLRANELARYRVLILPDLPGKYLKPAEKQALAEWVEAGGLLIGFATEGLGSLFGVVAEDEIPQPDDAFTTTATLRYVDPKLARSVMFRDDEDMPVLIVSPVKVLQRNDHSELARLLTANGRDLGRPAITLRDVGRGRAVYFCFNVAQTIWALHHGRPVDEDYDGDGKLRMSDAMITRPFTTRVPYADVLMYLLRNLIARQGLPFIHALPPMPDGDIPDAVFSYGGDDEGLTDDSQLQASATMRDMGLPYHINIMPHADGTFGISKDDYEQIRANGHEPSLHFNFIEGVEHPYKFSRREIQQQVDWYVEAFGELPICTVFHWVTWHGWTEVAEWLAGAGVKADNSRFIQYCPPTNPVNTVGFGFGTAYPFFHYHDWRKDNDRIRFLGAPIGGYEAGYRGGEVHLHVLRQAVEMARFWHLPMNLFYHPIYVAQYPACPEAIRQYLEHLEQIGLKALHIGPDRVTEWWLARSEAKLEQVERDETAISFRAQCDWPGGMIIQLLWNGDEPRVQVGGAAATWVLREEYGAKWLYIAVPAGEHQVGVR